MPNVTVSTCSKHSVEIEYGTSRMNVKDEEFRLYRVLLGVDVNQIKKPLVSLGY